MAEGAKAGDRLRASREGGTGRWTQGHVQYDRALRESRHLWLRHCGLLDSQLTHSKWGGPERDEGWRPALPFMSWQHICSESRGVCAPRQAPCVANLGTVWIPVLTCRGSCGEDTEPAPGSCGL